MEAPIMANWYFRVPSSFCLLERLKTTWKCMGNPTRRDANCAHKGSIWNINTSKKIALSPAHVKVYLPSTNRFRPRRRRSLCWVNSERMNDDSFMTATPFNLAEFPLRLDILRARVTEALWQQKSKKHHRIRILAYRFCKLFWEPHFSVTLLGLDSTLVRRAIVKDDLELCELYSSQLCFPQIQWFIGEFTCQYSHN